MADPAITNFSATPQLGSKQPHSLELEKALLAALMTIAESYERIEDLLDESQLYAQRHRQIYKAIVSLARSGMPYDVVLVRDWLEKQQKLDEIGGEAYLTQLINESPATLYNLVGYAQKVTELSTLRELQKAGVNLIDRVSSPDSGDLSEVLAQTEGDIARISESHSRTFSKQGPRELSEVLPDVINSLQQMAGQDGGIIGVPTGFTELDNKTLGLQKGDMVVVAARPSMGKTTFAMNLVEAALYQSLPVVVFSLEMPAEQIAMRMIASFGGIDMSKLRSGRLDEDGWSRVTNAVAHLAEKPLYIDDSRGVPPTEMRARCRRIAKNHGGKLGLVVIDYLQLMTVPGLDPNNRVGIISEISRSLKVLAQEMDCPVVALSQLNRSLENRPDKRPIMSDLRESGAIEQDADVIMFIYRDEVYKKEESKEKGIARIIIGKQRNGPIGTVFLGFEPQHLRFADLAPGHDFGDDE